MRMIECVPACPLPRILRVAIALICVASLLPAGDPPPPLAGYIKTLPKGRRIEVRMTSGVVLVGRVGAVRSDSFVLGPDHKGGVAQEVEYKDVRDVKIRSTVTEKWIIGITIFLVFAGLNAWFGDPRSSKLPDPGQSRGIARIP
jgi:hypothetical protein